MNPTVPTNFPSGDRRTIRVDFTPARPTTVPAVLLGAARILQANGLWHGDYLPDPFNRQVSTPHTSRPMNIVAAIRCAATGDPHSYSELGDAAIEALALSIGGGPYHRDSFALECHVDEWGDEPGRSADDAVALLESMATAPGRAA